MTQGARLAGLLATVVVVVGCGSGAAPATSAASTPPAATSVAATPTPTPSPPATSSAASPSSQAGGSPAADPMADLSIAPPYALAPLDAVQAAAFETGMKTSLGAMSSIVQVGARQITKDGQNGGLLLAMAFPGVPVSDTASFLDSVVGGAAGSAGGTVTSRTILGQDVRLIEGASTVIAAYRHKATIVFAYGRTTDETVAIITAVIQASE